MGLTVKQIEATQPGDKDVFLMDGEGLQLRIYPSGKRAWQFRYQFEGKRRVMPLGSYEHVTLKEARTKAAEARKHLDGAICPLTHATTEPEGQARQEEDARIERESRRIFGATVAEWFELSLSSRKDGGKETMRTFAKDVIPHLADKELGAISKADLLNILDRVKKRGAKVLANHIFGDLRQFFNWCEARDLITKHPLRGLKKTDVGGTQPERERVLSTDELKQLRDQLPAAHMERATEIAIWLMLATLARVGELTQARWEHINFNAGTWTIPAGNSKNAKEHTIFLSEFARRHFEELRSLNAWSEWAFPSTRNDGHVCLRSISKQIKDRQRDTALSNRSLRGLGALTLPGGNWTAHDLRRTGATMLGELGILSEVIEKCLNHVEANKLKRTYQRHELQAERREAWRRLGERLDEVINDKSRKVIPLFRVI
ncbi:MAG: tyrosine-type recombinase/integrase [Halothiobacillaceae bacterium]|nr:tyrosine-type recombinase/integrase [Halothiobacillaceae bacterium]